MASFNLLLVDDERPFVETMAQRLRQMGFAVECDFSATEALNRLEQDDTIDVVMLDVNRPDRDGMGTLETLKRKHPLVEVLVLTGHATIASAIEAMKLGAFDYLMKPCDIHDLISKAKQAASRKKQREAMILRVRMKPYITEQEREELISSILAS